MAMDLNTVLPFKVGQLAEAKSFMLGFRSAWFRCKIKKISFHRGKIGYSLEFFDYPDEKVTWTKLYQKPPQHSGSRGQTGIELMVRPPFPPFFYKDQVPDAYPESDVIAIINGTWKVGDLVDWWYSGCYWCGKVTQLIGKDEVQIELPEPPVGEGKSYKALCKDLRPSLDWSPDHGWTVPRSRDYADSHHCASLIRPNKQDAERNSMNNELKLDAIREGKPSHLHEVSDSLVKPTEGKPDGEGKAALAKPTEGKPDGEGRSSLAKPTEGKPDGEGKVFLVKPTERNERYSSLCHPPETMRSNDGECLTSGSKPIDGEVKASSVKSTEELSRKDKYSSLSYPPEIMQSNDGGYLTQRKPSDTIDGEVRDSSLVNPTENFSRKDRYSFSSHPPGVMQSNDGGHLTSLKRSESIDSSIMELEELAQKIKWLKGLLQFGLSWSNAMKASWKFLEHNKSKRS